MMKLEYGSDIAAQILSNLDIDYVALNPGASFRGLHESIVNYGGNKKPEVILCCHEEIAVSIAQGYAKAAGKPMAAAVHNVVGLLHSSMAIFNVWVDKTPVLVIGGTGPMAVEKRRPWIDWIHTALVQGNVVRDYVKWDDQPTSIDSMVESFHRGFRAAVSEPKGPVYICLDSDLQEQRINENYALPDPARFPIPTSPQADPKAIQEVARLLVHAEKPVVIADCMARNDQSFASLVELAELLSLPVIDSYPMSGRLNFPSIHPLDLSGDGAKIIPGADVILGLDISDFGLHLNDIDRNTGVQRSLISETTKVIHIGLNELLLRSWSQSIGRLQPMHLSITAEASLALPALIASCREEMKKGNPVDRKERFARLKARHDALRKEWQEKAAQARKEKPVAVPHLAAELWELVRNEDWVLVNGTLMGWTRQLWDWTKPYQWLGFGGGAGLGQGISCAIGGALALKGTGRLCIDIQPDGDLLFTPSALWTAAHHQIPLLVVVVNNRSYYNSENIQGQIAKARGRSTATQGIGTKIDHPAVDYAALARSFGLYGEGPIDDPEKVRPALERAIRHVKENGSCALVDVLTQPR